MQKIYKKTYKYRLYPNINQERELGICLETHRQLYNKALNGKQLRWETIGYNWSFFTQVNWFTQQMRRDNRLIQHPINAQSGKKTLRQLDKAYLAFFRRVKRNEAPGHPRLKNKDRFNSFSYVYGNGCKILKNNKLYLQYIGKIQVRWHRQIPQDALIKHVVIKQSDGKWYVCFSVELPLNKSLKDIPTAKVGIDIGLVSFVTTSNGNVLGSAQTLENKLPELKRRNQALARCKQGSKRRLVVKHGLTKFYTKIKNIRKDIHHKVTRSLVNEFGVIAVESLNITKMLKNRWLARQISDAGWCQFIKILVGKAEEAGCQVVMVDPKNTSRQCSMCGKVKEKRLSRHTRVYKCECGLIMDRDVNAAKNILTKALGLISLNPTTSKLNTIPKLVRAGPKVTKQSIVIA